MCFYFLTRLRFNSLFITKEYEVNTQVILVFRGSTKVSSGIFIYYQCFLSLLIPTINYAIGLLHKYYFIGTTGLANIYRLSQVKHPVTNVLFQQHGSGFNGSFNTKEYEAKHRLYYYIEDEPKSPPTYLYIIINGLGSI